MHRTIKERDISMADISLHNAGPVPVTCISNYFIDHFLSELSGEAVKVYLALLRLAGDRQSGFSCSLISSRVGTGVREVRTALDALSSKGLLSLDYDSEGELCDICINEIATDRTAEETPVRKEKAPVEMARPVKEETKEPPQMDTEATELRSDPEVKTILFIAQRYLGRTLSNKDLQMITYWYFDLHMSVDMIDYLITSSIEKGKTSISYMNQIAIAWYKKGIGSKEEAAMEQRQFSSEANAVRRAFGISGHALAPAELDFIDRWFHEWGFSEELVTEACSRAIVNTGKANYAYAEKILKGWHDKGIKTLDKVAESDSAHRQENEKKYNRAGSQQGKNKSSFSFSETNGYDDAAVAAAMLQRNNF